MRASCATAAASSIRSLACTAALLHARLASTCASTTCAIPRSTRTCTFHPAENCNSSAAGATCCTPTGARSSASSSSSEPGAMIPLAARGGVPSFPLAVFAIVALNILVFVQELNAPQPDALINSFAFIPYDVTHGVQLAPPAPPTLLTLITSQFLHGGFLHIFFNM